MEKKLCVADFRHYPQKLHRNLQSKACVCPTITYKVKEYLENKTRASQRRNRKKKVKIDSFLLLQVTSF